MKWKKEEKGGREDHKAAATKVQIGGMRGDRRAGDNTAHTVAQCAAPIASTHTHTLNARDCLSVWSHTLRHPSLVRLFVLLPPCSAVSCISSLWFWSMPPLQASVASFTAPPAVHSASLFDMVRIECRELLRAGCWPFVCLLTRPCPENPIPCANLTGTGATVTSVQRPFPASFTRSTISIVIIEH